METEEVIDSREETLRLALESILRWTDRSYDMEVEFKDSLIVRAIAKVAEVALDVR